MKTDKIFWGILLVFIGGVFLLENFGLIDFSWHYVWRFWPVILILSGINILSSRSHSKIGVIATAVITILFLGILTYKGLQTRTENNRWSWTFSDDDEKTDSTLEAGTESNYTEDFDSKYQQATLNVTGGASSFEVHTASDKLFESTIKENVNRYYLKKTATDSTVVLDFNSKSKNNKYSFNDEHFNKIQMMLNAKPLWDINLKIGAGKVDFDLSGFKVRQINFKGGAAEFKVKVGELYPDVNLTAETGVAEVKIAVPESAGCSIVAASGLSAKDFRGFDKKADGTYETANYRTAKNKIHIILKGGLSDFNVDRY